MKNLTPKHYDELKASCISDAIIARYFYSVAGDDAQQYLISDRISQLEDRRDNLGGHAQQYATAAVIKANKRIERTEQNSTHVRAGGWVCSANGQIKPNEPRQAVSKDEKTGEWLPVFNEDLSEKRVKYEARLEPLFEGSNKSYAGANVSLMQPESEPLKTSEGQNIVVVTEGGKKGGAVATVGITALPLPGVDMGAFKDENDAYHLIPTLAALPRDTALVIAFDQDSKLSKRKGVAKSARRLAGLLTQNGFTTIRVAKWSHKTGKGFDDVCAAKGTSAYARDTNS